MSKSVFIRGAWLYSGLDKPLSEKQFIEKAGGIAELNKYRTHLFVSLALDNDEPVIIGHDNGRTIALAMGNWEKWQTMEWRNPTSIADEYLGLCVECYAHPCICPVRK